MNKKTNKSALEFFMYNFTFTSMPLAFIGTQFELLAKPSIILMMFFGLYYFIYGQLYEYKDYKGKYSLMYLLNMDGIRNE